MSYHFTSEPVEDQVVTDVSNLNRFDDDVSIRYAEISKVLLFYTFTL